MDYELALKLKEAGFPQSDGKPTKNALEVASELLEFDGVRTPSLSELIEACGEGFVALCRPPTKDLRTKKEDCYWSAIKGEADHTKDREFFGKTPEEAVANLYIKLHENKER